MSEMMERAQRLLDVQHVFGRAGFGSPDDLKRDAIAHGKFANSISVREDGSLGTLDLHVILARLLVSGKVSEADVRDAAKGEG